MALDTEVSLRSIKKTAIKFDLHGILVNNYPSILNIDAEISMHLASFFSPKLAEQWFYGQIHHKFVTCTSEWEEEIFICILWSFLFIK